MKFVKDNHRDILIGLVAVASLLLGSNLFGHFMPSQLAMILIGLFVAAFALFAVLIWRENPRDEREAQILLGSDRFGFLAGAVTITVFLVIETFRHESTALLATILSVMILAKLIGKYLNR
ncbi:hypothetical protein KDA23_00380 [Candidatus Saccharibacteria bacterium]|nr:hypothetical protein [Candidatus Saccharibacteria bacterium]